MMMHEHQCKLDMLPAAVNRRCPSGSRHRVANLVPYRLRGLPHLQATVKQCAPTFKVEFTTHVSTAISCWRTAKQALACASLSASGNIHRNPA